MAVAKAGVRATPPQPAPRALVRFLRFRRMPDAALDAVRRELDTNDEFRTRVADAATEEMVGRSGWLFLARPQGWEAALRQLLEEADPPEPEPPAGRPDPDERASSRRVRAAEEGRRRAETAREKAERSLAAAREKATGLAAEVSDERRRRRQAEKDQDETRRRLAAAEAEARTASARAQREMERAERAEARLAELESSGRIDPQRAEDVLGGLRAASAGLADAVEAMGRALQPVIPPPAQRGPTRRPAAAGRRRRTPAKLPPGVFDDAPEAAAHLVRVPGASVLVDGYNASMAFWPSSSVAEQRRRLVDALAELVSRTGADVRVVFDGSDGARPAVSPPRSAVKVTFSPADVEADDVILDLVASLPAEVPVVVASDDHRVRDGARRRGANLLSTAQLASALGRET